MFCYQCEQTAGGKGCTRVGVCGKQPDVADKHDQLTAALIGLARAAKDKAPGPQTDELVLQSLFATITNVTSTEAHDALIDAVHQKGQALPWNPDFRWVPVRDPDIVSCALPAVWLAGMAAYAWHAYVLGRKDEVTSWFYKGCGPLVKNTVEEWLDLLMEFGQ